MYGSTEGLALIVVIFFVCGFLWTAAVLGGYVLKGIALFRLAKNAGAPTPGLAWVPIASTWLLGTLCDRSACALDGKRRNYAVILPALEALSALSGSIFAGVKGIFAATRLYTGTSSLARDAIGTLLSLAFLAAMVLALCRLYADYAPGRELLYAILSVIFGGLGRGILLMVIRNRVPLSAGPGGWPMGPPPGQGPPHYGSGTTNWDRPPGPPDNREGPEPQHCGRRYPYV